VLDLTAFLREADHRVVLAGDRGDWCPPENDTDYVHLALDDIAASGGSVFRRMSEILPVARRLRRALRRHSIQLVHAHETAPCILARLATMGLNIPVVFTYHGSEPNRVASVARTARRCADLTISPSRTSLDHLIAKGLAREKTRVIGLGVHRLPQVAPDTVAARRRDLLGENGKFLIASLSRLAPQKGIDMMIEVARKISDQRDDVVFAIGGHGPLSDIVQSWTEITGVSDNVKFLGLVSDVASVLAASDICLLTSRWEALPISIVEAFQAGLPVVATDCGGVRELVSPEVGVVLQVADTNAIAAAIIDLLDNPDRRRQMGAAAQALSLKERFSPPAVHQSFAELYAGLIDGA
jgi:glycosyltransferase involved in cell wall biosynthesis